MNKQILINAIDKAFIEMKDVQEYNIFWNLEDSVLTLRSAVTAFKTTTIAEIVLKGVDIRPSKFVIRDPAKLLNILDIAENDIEIEIDDQKYGERLLIKDKSFESQFTLSNSIYVKVKPAIVEEPISYDFVLPIDASFSEKYLKAKKANTAATVVSVEVKDRKARFELGDTTSFSNKIRFFVEDDGIFDMNKCLFSADAIREVVNTNKKSRGRISVSDETLMKISYDTEKMGDGVSMDISYFTLALDQL